MLQSSKCDQKLADAVEMPPTVLGHFRMSKENSDKLWEFTLHSVKKFVKALHTELDEVVAKSIFAESLKHAADQAMDSFYERAGASVGQENLVAALLLKNMLRWRTAKSRLFWNRYNQQWKDTWA